MKYVGAFLVSLVFILGCANQSQNIFSDPDGFLRDNNIVSLENDLGKKRKEYIENHPELFLRIKLGILNGKPEIGMNFDQAFLTVGRPEKVKNIDTPMAVNSHWLITTLWVPRDMSDYYDLISQHLSYTEALHLEFQNGKITEISRGTF
jgi:hypothetical protein